MILLILNLNLTQAVSLKYITSNKACWNGDKQFEQDCGQESVCASEMIVDWIPRGGHLYTVRRSCRTTPDEGTCMSSILPVTAYKDCIITCDDDNCNNDLDTIAQLFYVGNVESCWKCSYIQNSNGTVEGQPACSEELDSNSSIKQETCPIYANAACFTASSLSKNEENVYFEDDYRGCSPFEGPNGYAEGYYGKAYKSTCTTNNCNTSKHQLRKQCYTCKSTRGTSGMPLGTGDERCWDEERLVDS